MKQLCILICLFVTVNTYGQSAAESLQKGIEKHNAKDYEGAIKEYTNAIKADKKLRDGYYNRGVCEQALIDMKAARKDFDKTIEIDPSFVKAYYSRATIAVSEEHYKEALSDLDKTIQLDAKTPNALSLRGQLRAQTGNKKGACEDFNLAKEYGDAKAAKYLAQFCGNEQQAGESLMLDWPESENWKVGDNQENNEQHVLDLIHSNETIEKWTELGNMTAYKGMTAKIPMDKAMELMFDQAKKNAPKAKLTFLEKDEKAEYPWILFTIEAPGFNDDKTPESQLWYIIQGKQALYTNFRAVKKASISAAQKEKWMTFFKTGKIVNK